MTEHFTIVLYWWGFAFLILCALARHFFRSIDNG